MSRDSVVATSQCVQALVRTVFHHAMLSPCKTTHIITVLDTQHNFSFPMARAVQVCCHLGQRKFPPGWSLVRNWFIDHPQDLMLNLPPYSQILNPMEGIWSPTPPTHTPSPSDGGGLWWHRQGGMPGLDMPLQTLLPLLFSQWEHCLWCWCGTVARPK